MGIFDQVIQFASMGVMAWGAGLAIVGIINFSEGHSQQNAARKEEGMGKYRPSNSHPPNSLFPVK